MKEYSRIFESRFRESITHADEFVAQLDNAIRKHFPKSFIKVAKKKSLGEHHIYLNFYVGATRANWANGIPDNDISRTAALIYGVDEEGNLAPRLRLNTVTGGTFIVKPTSKYLAYSHIKVGFRKKTGTPEQIVQHVDKYFAKLSQTIKLNLDKIPDDHLALLKGII